MSIDLSETALLRQLGTKFLAAGCEFLFSFQIFYVIGTYGLTTSPMNNGDKYEVPKHSLQLQETYALINYRKNCEEIDFESLRNTKFYDILNSIEPAQK